MQGQRVVNLFVTMILSSFITNYSWAATRIVAWNGSPLIYEKRLEDIEKIKNLESTLSPDVLVMTELVGRVEADIIAEGLGWDNVYSYVSEWSTVSTRVHFALEVGVFSKYPIKSVVEYEPKPDGKLGVVIHNGEETGISVSEQPISSEGTKGISEGAISASTRTTIRVDLENGLSIFPVHLKSNYNSACGNLASIQKAYKKLGWASELEGSPVIEAYENGSDHSVKEHLKNAIKREKVIAAVLSFANKALNEGRIPVIAGDYNTSFEPGKFGSQFEDCELKAFTCNKAPFPANACEGDGYDDTFAILMEPLVGDTQWSVLSQGLGRTYDDLKFGDYAIDHIAVPSSLRDRFTDAKKVDDAFGSDHFPVWSVFE